MKFLAKMAMAFVLCASAHTVFAQSVDQFVGVYQGFSRNGQSNGTAEIKKVLVAQPTLFEEAKYEYVLSMDYQSSKGPTIYLGGEFKSPEKLDILGDALSLTTSDECDDPSCWYLNEINIITKISKKGTPYIELYFDADRMEPEDDEQEVKASGTKLFYKIK